MYDEGQEILMHRNSRPKTAATTTFYDESRIKDKIAYLENIELSIDTNIEKLLAQDITKPTKKVQRLTKSLICDNAMCDELGDVQTLMLRDKGIDVFDDTHAKDKSESVLMLDLCNIECLIASHNRIKDLLGISQLTSLIELNLSFNQLTDLNGIENLTLLQSLYLNRNQLTIITPIEDLKGLKALHLYHNRIIEPAEVIRIITGFPKLKELSLEGNPCAQTQEFNYELILRLPKLRMLNDDAVKEMDRDVAKDFLEMQGVTIDLKPSLKEPVAERPQTA